MKFRTGGRDGVMPTELGDDIFQMDVDLHSLVFTHHHLMSLEHVMAQRLRQLYDEYQGVVEKDAVGYCQQRVRTWRILINSF